MIVVLRRPFQEGVRLFRQAVGDGLEGLVGLDAEDEADVAGGVPAVQVLGLGELGVAPQEHLAEAGPAAEVDGLVEVDVGLLVRGAVARAVDQEQRLGRVGQRDQKGMIAPGALVGDVDVALALGVGADQRAVGVDDRLVEELRRLLRPRRGGGSRLKASIRVRMSGTRNRRQKSPSVVGSGMRSAPTASR